MTVDSFKVIEQKFLEIYPNNENHLDELLKIMKKYYSKRSKKLKKNDENGIEWLKSENTVGIMLYVDLFCENLNGLLDKVNYFKGLGITLIHLMPLLKPREGENDGGYAVSDYKDIDPRLGDMEIFKKVIDTYKKYGIKICIDYVVNHTSDQHEWALEAKKGNREYQDFYRMYEDDRIPKEYEKKLNQVFPEVAPGNFTYLNELDKWVMTRFYPFQWDLNYNNPEVFNKMLENLLFLANLGIDMIRLDAIPYMWKEIGTDCVNLDGAHKLLKLFRMIVGICAPSTALLGEAIVAPQEIVKYFGDENPECDVLYNASYMVEIWNSLATRDARHLAHMPEAEYLDKGIWINYARCHDDIGWGLNEKNVSEMGFDPFAHKRFLIDFYLGALKGSFSIGELYEFNPLTMDARNCGTLASLAGMERALKESDEYQKELAIKRIKLINALIVLRKGIPMIYSGDEIGALNNYSYKQDPKKRHDSRWLHRFNFPWEIMNKENSYNLVVHNYIKYLIDLRKQLKACNQERIIQQGNSHVMILAQLHENHDVMLLFNLSEDRQWVYSSDIKRYGYSGRWIDQIQGKKISWEDESILLGPYEYLVLKEEENE